MVEREAEQDRVGWSECHPTPAPRVPWFRDRASGVQSPDLLPLPGALAATAVPAHGRTMCRTVRHRRRGREGGSPVGLCSFFLVAVRAFQNASSPVWPRHPPFPFSRQLPRPTHLHRLDGAAHRSPDPLFLPLKGVSACYVSPSTCCPPTRAPREGTRDARSNSSFAPLCRRLLRDLAVSFTPPQDS